MLALLIAAAISNPSQISYTANSGVQRSLASKLSDIVTVCDFEAACPSGNDVPTLTSLEGSGMAATILLYSGTGCAVTIDSTKFARLANLEIQTTSTASTVRGACVTSSTGNTQNFRMENIYFLQNSGTSRNSGQIALLVDGSVNGVYWSWFRGLFANLWDTSYRDAGDNTNQGNSNHFEVVSAAANTPFYVSRGNDNYVEVHCTTSDATLNSGTQVCLTVGDTATLSSGNEAHVFSDQGATGQGVAVATAASTNLIFSDNESTNADTDSGTSTWFYSRKLIGGLSQSFSVPTFRNTGAFANAGVLLSSSAVQFSDQRSAANVDVTGSTSDRYVRWTSLSAAHTYTLPTAAQGLEIIIKDESGSASASNTISAVGTVDGTVNKTLINTAFGVARLRANGTAWFTY
jgi:hypothetical protein